MLSLGTNALEYGSHVALLLFVVVGILDELLLYELLMPWNMEVNAAAGKETGQLYGT